MKIGLISDTHGLLRGEALEALKQCDHLIHAGDIGNPGILVELERIAPLSAIRGNNDDHHEWAADIPARLLIRFGRVCVYVLHDLKALDLDPVADGINVVISGHSHAPRQELRDGVLYVNPGSAGPRRFKLPVTVGYLQIDGGSVSAELKTLLP